MGVEEAPEGRLPKKHHYKCGKMLHQGDAFPQLPETTTQALREAQRLLRGSYEVHRARAQISSDFAGGSEEAADFRECCIVTAEGSVRVVFGVVPASQIYVVPAERGEDELQGTVHRVQEQIHPLPARNDQGGA